MCHLLTYLDTYPLAYGPRTYTGQLLLDSLYCFMLCCASQPGYITTTTTRMWANAQRDGRPAKYRWRSPRQVWLTPTTRVACSNAAKTRKPLKFAGVPKKLLNRSQPPMGRSSPYCEEMWRTYYCLTSFSPIVDTCLSYEDSAQQSCAMVPRWRIFGDFWVLHF